MATWKLQGLELLAMLGVCAQVRGCGTPDNRRPAPKIPVPDCYRVVEVPSPGGGHGDAINQSGSVVGVAFEEPAGRATLWIAGEPAYPIEQHDRSSVGIVINDTNHVAGWSGSHAFFFEGSDVRDLGAMR